MTKSEKYRVKVTVGDATLDIEGAETGVVRIVEALSDVLRGTKRGVSSQSVSGAAPVSPSTTRSAPIDIRHFFDEKKPSSDVEASAATAYYYAYLVPERERKETINAITLQEAFRQAGRPLPARTIFTLQNARNAGYLDSVGDGQYRLNPVGYNLVEHALGREKTSKSTPRKSKPKSKKPRKK